MKKERIFMKIAIGNDHAGLEAKEEIKKLLQENNYDVIDYGTNSPESCDYPIFAEKVGNAVSKQEADLGILICGSGIGMSIVANKCKNIRASLCTSTWMAEVTRKHNDANVLCMGARVNTIDELKQMAMIWLKTEFEGGRHQRRVNLISEIENRQHE